MYRTKFVLSGLTVATAIAMAGCGPQDTTAPAAVASAPAPATSPATVPATTAPATTAAANKAATMKACGELKKDLKDNAARVADAKKIGPPAGHIAVSAQWAAGSTAVIAHSIGTDPAVSAAADKVEKEMMVLSDKYNASGRAKPSEAKLAAAIKELTAACAAA